MDYEESLQDSSLAQLIRANTGIKLTFRATCS